MKERPPDPDHLDSIADLYREAAGQASDPLLSALETWDHEKYRPLKLTDPELYRLICKQLGFEAEILLGNGTVKLGQRGRHIEITWNGDDEDLLDLVLECAGLIADP
jgi:hypothetical protein